MTGSLSRRSGDDRQGRWQLRVSTGRHPVTGKYGQTTRSFAGSKAQAKRALAQLVTEVEADRPAAGAKMTLADLLDRFVADREARGRAGETVKHYRQQTEVIRPGLGQVPIGKLTAEQLDDFYAGLTARKMMPTTVAKYHALIRAALNMAVQRRWLAYNVAPASARPTPQRADLTVPRPEEVRMLVRCADLIGDQIAMFLRLAVDTWCRPQEVCAMRRSTVSLERGEVLVDTAISTVGDVKDTKTHSRRLISLAASTLDELTVYYERREKAAELAGVDWAADAFLFSDDPTGERPWRPWQPSDLFARVKAKAAIERVRLYDLRHFGPTQALQHGESIVAVSHRLGHRRVSTTLDVYAAWIPASDQALSSLMGSILGSDQSDELNP